MELLANAPDESHFLAAAQATGFADQGRIITQGPGFFLNFVGVQYAPTGQTTVDEFGNTVPEMAARPGVWARLRLNQPDAAFFAFLQAVQAAGLTVYRQIADPDNPGGTCWSSDGVTCAADQTVGLIGQIM